MKNKLYMNPNNTDYWILIYYPLSCLRNTNATNRFLTFRSNHLTSVYILPEYYSIQVSEKTIVEDQLPESCAENRLQIRNLPNVFSGDILTKFTKISFQKRENILFFLLPKQRFSPALGNAPKLR